MSAPGREASDRFWRKADVAGTSNFSHAYQMILSGEFFACLSLLAMVAQPQIVIKAIQVQ